MAKLAVDRIVEREGREAPCRTHEIQLGMPVDPSELPDAPGVDEESRVHLASRYGHAANLVMRLAAAEPELAKRITPDLPDIASEAAFAVEHEQAFSVADVLLRRTRLGLLNARRLGEPGADGPLAVARAMGEQLGWDEAQVEREVAQWHDVARAEGLVPASRAPAQSAGASDGVAPREEPSPAAPGAAPEEAA
jgi:glycerol-3-phosphate dehydrogenase